MDRASCHGSKHPPPPPAWSVTGEGAGRKPWHIFGENGWRILTENLHDLAVFLPRALPALPDTLIRVPPHLVVEVASPRPRDVHRDRVEKLTDYARAGIRLYAIVDPQLRSLEVYELGRDGRYAVARAAGRGRVRVPGCPGLVLDLGALWKEVDEAERTHARAARRRRR